MAQEDGFDDTAMFPGATHDVVLARGEAPEFGSTLRDWRNAKKLSLREAAAELDVSFTYLQKLETGGRARSPSLALLQRIAAVFAIPTGEVFQAAGVTKRRVQDASSSIDRAFRRVVLHPRLRPLGMNEVWLDSFSTKQKRQVLELVQRTQALVIETYGDGALPIDDIMRGLPPLDDEDDQP
ncbi:MAG: XRE family transcriptional regulator [Deltaproteobacteria bacterium]|nr:MAG: XRE family transcriptional regulator [Deltaproteobacteria bacterium]